MHSNHNLGVSRYTVYGSVLFSTQVSLVGRGSENIDYDLLKYNINRDVTDVQS